MKNRSTEKLKTTTRKYSIKIASLFLSTLLLMNGTPVITVAAEEQTDDTETVETTEINEVDETDNNKNDENQDEDVNTDEEESEEAAPEIAVFAATSGNGEENPVTENTDETTGTGDDEGEDSSNGEDVSDEAGEGDEPGDPEPNPDPAPPAPEPGEGDGSGETDENIGSDDSEEGDGSGETDENIGSDEPGEDDESGESDENPVVETDTDNRTKEIPFEVEYVNDSTLPEGEEQISQEGVPGIIQETIEIRTYEDGTFEEEVIHSEIITEVRPQIIQVGTMVEEESQVDPGLQVNPIYPEAETITGTATPSEAKVVVLYPGTDRQRSADVNSDGSWMVRNIGGDSRYLTEGSTVPMQLIYDDEIHDYEDQFYVQEENGTPDYYAAEDDTVDVANDNTAGEENTSSENISSSSISGISETSETTESLETLPETGESVNGSALGIASLTAGLGLMFIGKKKESKEVK